MATVTTIAKQGMDSALCGHYFFLSFKRLIYLRERERARAQAGGRAEAEGEAGSPVSREPNAGLDPSTLRSEGRRFTAEPCRCPCGHYFHSKTTTLRAATKFQLVLQNSLFVLQSDERGLFSNFK